MHKEPASGKARDHAVPIALVSILLTEYLVPFLNSKGQALIYKGSWSETEEQVLKAISDFRADFKARPGWEKGSPKRANNVTDYWEKEKKQGRANMP